MKKAKLALVSLVVSALLGAFFAFKVTKFTGLFAWTTTVGTITFTTAPNGPIFTASNVAYCKTTSNVTFLEPFPGAPTFLARTLPVAGIITGTAPGGITATALIAYKTCGNLTIVYVTNAQ